MRVVVLGYQEIGYICLEELVNFGADVACLFTHEDDPGEEIWFRRPAAVAAAHNIPIYTPDNIRDEKWIKIIGDAAPDFIFSFYYRHMVPRAILDIPRVAALNLHGSLLPKFRGRAPANWVLVKGESTTGITLHRMVEKPDAGDIVAQKEIAIAFDDDINDVYRKMTGAARDLMRETLPRLADGTFESRPQTGESSYYGGRKPEDGRINWQDDAITIYNLTRAVTHPYPGAFTSSEGKRVFVWKSYPETGAGNTAPGTVVSVKPFVVATGKGLLEIKRAQREGDPEMDGEAFASTYNMANKLLGGNI